MSNHKWCVCCHWAVHLYEVDLTLLYQPQLLLLFIVTAIQGVLCKQQQQHYTRKKNSKLQQTYNAVSEINLKIKNTHNSIILFRFNTKTNDPLFPKIKKLKSIANDINEDLQTITKTHRNTKTIKLLFDLSTTKHYQTYTHTHSPTLFNITFYNFKTTSLILNYGIKDHIIII